MNCLNDTSALRLLGYITTCLAQTTTASRLLFASTWHFVPQECEIFDFNFFLNNVQSWWRNNSMMSNIFMICCGNHISSIKIHIVSSFHVSISYGVWDKSIYVIFHTFKNVTITSQNISPGGILVSSINSIHINIYIHTYIYIL